MSSLVIFDAPAGKRGSICESLPDRKSGRGVAQGSSGAGRDLQHQACRAARYRGRRGRHPRLASADRRPPGGGRRLQPKRLRRPGGGARPPAGDGRLLRSRDALRRRLVWNGFAHLGRLPRRLLGRAPPGRRCERRGTARAPRLEDRGPARLRRAPRSAHRPPAAAGGGDRPRDRRLPFRGPARRHERGARRRGSTDAGRGRVPRRLGRGARGREGDRALGSPAGAHRSGAPRPRSVAPPGSRSDRHRGQRPRPGGGGDLIRFVLHRPRSSQNIGAAARALANTGAGSLWVVEPLGFDRAQAARLAAGADAILDSMRVVRTLPEALEECVDVVMTTGRTIKGSIEPRETAERLLAATGECALVFGDEVNGLPAVDLRRANALATIPTAEKSSLNLAQAVMVFGYEILLAKREPPRPPPRGAELANERLLGLLRDRAQALLLRAGFLNPQQPDRALDEMLQVLRRARPTRREVEMLLGALDQVARNVR
ncbi:MAG: hypothetical protein E6J61_13780 [Deltaproteobacteria bacterium]|nr:MAG: hypothetical protein E6J61_13780 [Deltaproteobacteria bacterium]